MDEEKQLTEQESLELIASMIAKAKCDYSETGVGALMWGTIITFCSLVTFAGYFLHWDWVSIIWYLPMLAVIPQIIISVKETKAKKYKTHTDDAMAGIWISFGISLSLLSYFVNKYHVPHEVSIFLVLYGYPTFSSGIARKFKPMIIGGIACWILAIFSMFVAFPYTMLISAAEALLAWFIPGLILRGIYLKAKKHV